MIFITVWHHTCLLLSFFNLAINFQLTLIWIIEWALTNLKTVIKAGPPYYPKDIPQFAKTLIIRCLVYDPNHRITFRELKGMIISHSPTRIEIPRPRMNNKIKIQRSTIVFPKVSSSLSMSHIRQSSSGSSFF